MSSYNVAVVGASGAVGREMVKILEERSFPVKNLRLMATERSAGTEICFKGESICIEVTKRELFKGVDIALFSAGSGPSKKIAPMAAEEGAVVIDNSNAFRMDEGVPLVVPEINPEDIFKHKGIIANPNCSTIQMVVALNPIQKEVGIKRIIVSTYQAVSGTGKKAIDELEKQIEQHLNNEKLKNSVYPYQIAFNALPQIDIFMENDYTKEEMKMLNETQKIFHDPAIMVNATCVRIPVFYGHSEAVTIETCKKISIDKVTELLNNAEGVKVIDNPQKGLYPLATFSESNDNVLVGRIRKDISCNRGINLWIVANNLRKGAALNTVQIAEKLIQ